MKRLSLNSQQPLAKPSTSHQPKTGSLLTRRNLLLLLGGSVAALGTSQWIKQSAIPQTKTQQYLADSALLTDTKHIDFLALSMLLTSHQHLHPQTSADIYAALSEQIPEFEQKANALFQFTQVHHFSDANALVNAIKNKAKLVPLTTVLHRIVAAWYLGVVYDEVLRTSTVIAFESALMFDPVRDVVGVPTYCHCAPGYWVAQPPVRK